MKKRNIALLSCAAACLALAQPAAAAKARKSAERDFYWYYYPIDTTGLVQDAEGMTTGAAKLRYDSQGTPKVAYGIGSDVYYAELDGNVWKGRLADTACKYEAKLSLDLDAEGNPHIVHENWRYNVIHYATWDGTEWTRKILDTILDETFGNFYGVSLKVDSKKDLHLFYPRMNSAADGHSGATYGRFGADLNRVRRDPLCNCGSSGKWAGLILDSKESPVIAYYTNSIEKVQVAHLDAGGAWLSDTITAAEFPGPNGQYASIGRDGSDSLYISHHNRDSAWLLMSSGRAGGPYKTEKVAPLGANPLWIAPSPIAVTRSGTPYIAYLSGKQEGQYRVSEGKLRIAWKKDGAWSTETVDSSATITGLFADIALNKDSLPSIVYFNYSKKQLWLAVARPTAPADANGNGILDYRETPITTVGVRAPGRQLPRAKAGPSFFDAQGKAAGSRPKAGKRPRVIFSR